VTTPTQPGHGTATIKEWDLSTGGLGKQVDPGVNLTVDFDPRSLELRYSAGQRAIGQQTQSSGQQRNSAPAQLTSDATTLSMQLIFDSTDTGTSVQLKTDPLVTLIRQPSASDDPNNTTPATVVRFNWGSFIFFGFVGSLSQTIDYFSFGGVPLRATVDLVLNAVAPPASPTSASSGAAPPTSFGAGVGVAGGAGVSAGAGASLSAGASASAGASFSAGASASAGASFSAGASASAGASFSAGASASVGTTPLTLSAAGDTVQDIAAQAGTSVSWKVVAAANNIDNPRILPPGTVLDLSAGGTASVSASAGATASASAGVQIS
jgi:hypothetical protein